MKTWFWLYRNWNRTNELCAHLMIYLLIWEMLVIIILISKIWGQGYHQRLSWPQKHKICHIHHESTCTSVISGINSISWFIDTTSGVVSRVLPPLLNNFLVYCHHIRCSFVCAASTCKQFLGLLPPHQVSFRVCCLHL